MLSRAIFILWLAILSAVLDVALGFQPRLVVQRSKLSTFMSSETSEDADVSSVEIPTYLPSSCGVDYVPLATMLATGKINKIFLKHNHVDA